MRDRESRKDREVRRVEQVRPPGIEHRPPAWRRRLDAETEEAQRRLGDDRARHAERRLNDDGGQRRRQDMAQHDARRAGAERARRLDELELPRAQRLAAHETRVAHPPDHRERDHDVPQAGAEDGDQRDRQQDPRKRHQDVDRRG